MLRQVSTGASGDKLSPSGFFYLVLKSQYSVNGSQDTEFQISLFDIKIKDVGHHRSAEYFARYQQILRMKSRPA